MVMVVRFNFMVAIDPHHRSRLNADCGGLMLTSSYWRKYGILVSERCNITWVTRQMIEEVSTLDLAEMESGLGASLLINLQTNEYKRTTTAI